MTLKPARGTALRQHVVMVRFETDHKPGPRLRDRCLGHRVVEIRKLLRTEKSIEAIADELGVCTPTLRNFIKRRNICNLKDRSRFITQQRSIAREEAKEAAR